MGLSDQASSPPPRLKSNPTRLAARTLTDHPYPAICTPQCRRIHATPEDLLAARTTAANHPPPALNEPERSTRRWGPPAQERLRHPHGGSGAAAGIRRDTPRRFWWVWGVVLGQSESLANDDYMQWAVGSLTMVKIAPIDTHAPATSSRAPSCGSYRTMGVDGCKDHAFFPIPRQWGGRRPSFVQSTPRSLRASSFPARLRPYSASVH
jgi:hypothetical protein